MIKIIARISSKAEATPELSEILKALVKPSRAESGCLSYELFQDEENLQDFVTVESWADQAAADTHMATEHVTEAITKASSLLAQPPVIHRFTQLA